MNKIRFITIPICILLCLSACLFRPPTPTNTPTPPDPYLQSLANLGLDDYIDIRPARQEKVGNSDWTAYFFDKADARCILGDEYSVLARPGRQADKTVFWMDGGGACWPGVEKCTQGVYVQQYILQDQGLASPSDANPLAEWNFVHVPYCDGSVHMGDSRADYDQDGQADHDHWGLRNTSAAVALMKALFPQTQQILIAGCSAGGYGTLLATPLIRLQYPQAQLAVLNISGLGLYNPKNRQTFDLILDTWNLAPRLPADCPMCREQLINLYPWLLARDTKLRIGVYSSYYDRTISNEFIEMTPEDFKALLLSSSGAIHDQFPEAFKRFFIEGDSHCVQNYFYKVDGISLRDWIDALVNDSAEWQDLLE